MSQTKAQLLDALIASLLPASDSSVDIGSNGVRFANIYGDTLYGDGSNLTGITSTTINSNAANRLITGSGTANTLNGNSDLLWNGSRLDIDTGGTEDALRIGSSSGADTFIRLGSINTTADTHAVIKYDIDDNYLSLLVSGESHGNGGMLIANGGAVSLSAGTSPLAKLHVKDDVYVKGSSGDGSTGIQIRSGSSAISGQHEVRTGGGSGNMLIINAAGATGLLQAQTNGTEKLRIDSSGRLLIGISTARANFGNNTSGVQQHIQLEGTSAITSSMSLIRNSNDVNDGGIIVGKTRGTSTGSNTVVQAGDDLGNISFVGADGTSMQFGADIKATVESGVGNDDMPAALVFSTNSGTTSTAERMRIDSAGRVGINGSGVNGMLEVRASGGGGNTQLTAVFGANEGTTAGTLTNNNDKAARIGFNHYSTSEEPFCFVSAGSGSSSNSIAFGGGTSTMNAATQLTFFTAANTTTTTGSERMRIDSSGNLGIGTTSPNTKLQVTDAIANEAKIRIETSDGGNKRLDLSVDSNGHGTIASLQSASQLIFKSRTHHIFQNTSSETESMRIDSSGNLGLGTASPTARFDVRRSDADGKIAEFHQSAGYGVDIGSSQSVAYISSGYGQALAFKTDPSSGQVERMRIDSSGRLVVGSTSAFGNLGFTTSAGIQAVGAYNVGSIVSVNNENNGNTCAYTSAKIRGTGAVGDGDIVGSHAFDGYDGGTFRNIARIDGVVSSAVSSNSISGDLIFRTRSGSTQAERLHIHGNGDISFNNCTSTINSSNYGLYLLNDSNSTKSIYLRHSREANGTHSTAEFHGNQGSMQVFGDGDLKNTNNSYGSLSDVTLKQDIVDASSQWDDIKAIKVRKFRFKDNPTGDLHIGVVAQELETVSPKLVTEVAISSDDLTSTETVKSVKYSVLYMKAIKALQETMTRIETLETEVAALKAA